MLSTWKISVHSFCIVFHKTPAFKVRNRMSRYIYLLIFTFSSTNIACNVINFIKLRKTLMFTAWIMKLKFSPNFEGNATTQIIFKIKKVVKIWILFSSYNEIGIKCVSVIQLQFFIKACIHNEEIKNNPVQKVIKELKNYIA
jgi:hypothetical protein